MRIKFKINKFMISFGAFISRGAIFHILTLTEVFPFNRSSQLTSHIFTFVFSKTLQYTPEKQCMNTKNLRENNPSDKFRGDFNLFSSQKMDKIGDSCIYKLWKFNSCSLCKSCIRPLSVSLTYICPLGIFIHRQKHNFSFSLFVFKPVF